MQMQLNNSCAGILKQSMGARNRVGIGLLYRPARARIFKLLRSPRIDSKEPILPGLCSLAGRYDNPIPTRFLVPIDCLKFQHWLNRLAESESKCCMSMKTEFCVLVHTTGNPRIFNLIINKPKLKEKTE